MWKESLTRLRYSFNPIFPSYSRPFLDIYRGDPYITLQDGNDGGSVEDIEDIIIRSFRESSRVKVVDIITQALNEGNKILLFGNGGSAADAQHLAAEFVNRFLIERPPLPAIALSTDTSVITSIANDYDFSEIFSKQIRAIGREGDVAWGISTSGSSPNVLKAFQVAAKVGMTTIAFTGRDGGKIAGTADICLNVSANSTPRIQEAHITAGHVICEMVDYRLFKKPGKE